MKIAIISVLTALLLLVLITNISAVAMCEEGRFYTENHCIRHCVNGANIDVQCCGENSVILFNETNRDNYLGGFECAATTPYYTPNNHSFTPLLIGVIGILVIVILALIIIRIKKK